MATPLTQGVGVESITYKNVPTLAVEEGMYVLMLSSQIITTVQGLVLAIWTIYWS